MNREQAIANIEALYPADSQYIESAKIGQQLLEQAKREVNGWRTEPTEVLIRYAELCMYLENKETQKLQKTFRKY